ASPLPCGGAYIGDNRWWLLRIVKDHFNSAIGSFTCRGQQSVAIVAEGKTMRNQFLRGKTFLLNKLCRNVKGRCSFVCTQRPGFHPLCQCANQVDLLIPDGREIDASHPVQADSYHDDCAASAYPAQGIVGGSFAGDSIIDDIIATQHHLIAKHALV